MHAFFRPTGFHMLNSKNENFMVGVLFLDKEIEELKQQGRWESNLELKDLLLQKISPIETGFSDQIKVIVAMDSSFVLRKIQFQEDFLKEIVASGEFIKVQEMALQAVNAATKAILKALQKNLKTHDISMKDYIDRILLNHEKKDLWFNLESKDEHGNHIEFYAPWGEMNLSSLGKLERYN